MGKFNLGDLVALTEKRFKREHKHLGPFIKNLFKVVGISLNYDNSVEYRVVYHKETNFSKLHFIKESEMYSVYSNFCTQEQKAYHKDAAKKRETHLQELAKKIQNGELFSSSTEKLTLDKVTVNNHDDSGNCTCGIDSIGGGRHSTWCAKYE